jgi:hypothetical protein
MDESRGGTRTNQGSSPSVPRGTLTKEDVKTLGIYAAGFRASEFAHGKDEAMKWHALNRSCAFLGYQKLEQVPADMGTELLSLIKSYPSWWRGEGPVEEPESDPSQSGEVPF